MTNAILGPTGGKRRRRLLLFVPFALLTALILAIGASAVGAESGFEDDDGNLAPNPAGLNFDWNSFAPTTWTGTAPTRTAEDSAGGWSFTGLEDAQNTTSDSAFLGGSKQDADCASVGTQKASNKDDLTRAYFASNTVNDHVYLNLAWVRIDQNTTSSSAHVAFEFNQGSTPCPAGSDSLVRRSTANGGDMLIVYDFAGGTATPTIRLSRWIATGSCEVGSNSPPCWSVAQTLGAGVAEAAVNTGTTVQDGIAPPPPVPPVPLGDSEFGEAGIDLTDAGVFPPGECVNFGQGFAVSRSSGNSSQAQMKDLVGPGEVNIQNCGNVIIRKVTDPDPDPTDTTFDYTTTGGLDPDTFSLKNGEFFDYGSDVFAGQYSVTESDPGPTFALTDIDCSASDLSHGSTVTEDEVTLTASFDLKALDTIDCTYTNTLQVGALQILKNSTKGGPVSEAGAVFSYDGSSVTDNGAGDEDPTVGEVCVSGLLPGDYDVTETSAPPGYGLPVNPGPVTATVVTGTNCTDNPPTGSAVVTFTDPPLADIQVNFRDGGSGETSATSIVCDNTGTTPDTTPATGWDDSVTHEDIRIDPSPRTITCTIVIDP
jgi:hypothetical protein